VSSTTAAMSAGPGSMEAGMGVQRRPRRGRRMRAWLALPPEWVWTVLAAGVPPLVAAALIPLRGRTLSTNTALIMVVAVVALAVPGRRWPAALAGFGAGVWFDFFLVRPYYSFAISQRNEAETTGLLLVVGIIVGELTARARRARAHAVAATVDIARIHAVAEMVAEGASVDDVIGVVTDELTDLLALRECRFETSFADRPGPFIERTGGVTWGALSWSPGTMGLPSKEVTLVVQGQGHPFGRFVLLPSIGVPVSLDRLTVAVALVDQVGAAMAAA
jgi:hypothetical protein